MDVNLFRVKKGGNPDLVRKSQKARGGDVEVVDRIIEIDDEWVKLEYKLNQGRKEKRELSKKVGAAKKAKDEKAAEEATAVVLEKNAELKKLEEEMSQVAQRREDLIASVGNLVHPSVPDSLDEVNNEVVATFGEAVRDDNLRWHHHELLYMIGGYNTNKGISCSGNRGYYLTGVGAMLNLALINYSVQFLSKKGYTIIQPPLMMKKEAMSEVAQLSQFDEELYHVTTGASKEKEGGGDDKYLIATAEQPLCHFQSHTNFEAKDLPKRYGAWSSCFRKEAGSASRDTWGIFRVHQFEKIEQFCVTKPTESWEEHEKMIMNSREFYESLGIPYRVVNLVSGELNLAAAKKYDLEGWLPSYGEYRELVSCSNCTDYQSRKVGAKYNSKEFVHMLNSTLCATTRTICAILENYQTDDGVKVPEALQPFMGTDTMPFVNKPQKGWKKSKQFPISVAESAKAKAEAEAKKE